MQRITISCVFFFLSLGSQSLNISSILTKFSSMPEASQLRRKDVKVVQLKERKVSRSLSSVKRAQPDFAEEKSAFLSDEDVSRLTGYRHSNKIISALNRLSIPFILNARGRPLVLRSAFEPREGAFGGKTPKHQKKEWRPL